MPPMSRSAGIKARDPILPATKFITAPPAKTMSIASMWEIMTAAPFPVYQKSKLTTLRQLRITSMELIDQVQIHLQDILELKGRYLHFFLLN